MRHENNAWIQLLIIAAVLAPLPARAAGDLDLLTTGNIRPNVMLVLDNSGSMEAALSGSTRIEVAGDALKTLVNNLYPDDGSGGYDATVRLGLARFDPTGTKNGGQIVETIASDNKAALLSSIDAIVAQRLAPGAPGTGTPLSEALVDVGRYFAGEHGFGTYPSVATTSPIDLVCRDNFVVFITDGEPNEDQNTHYGIAASGTTAHQTFVDTIGNADGDSSECAADAPATCIDDPRGGRDDGFVYSSSSGTDWFDDVAYYLANTDLVPDATLGGMQNVKTYTIGFTTNNVLLEETALNGKGEYTTASDATQLASSLQASFNSIFQNTRTAFSGAVVPGSSIGFGNAYYNTWFVATNEPVWSGHLEALRISSTGEIQGSDLMPAVDPTTGAMLPGRVPYWDAAVRLANDTSRTLYTTKSGARTTFVDSNLNHSDLAISSADVPNYPNYPASGVDSRGKLEDALIDYVHGRDAFDEDGDGDATELRAVVLGDIFHSTPRAVARPTRFTINEPGYLAFYNAYKQRDRVLYAGANDGLLHAFDAGRFTNGNDPATPENEPYHYTPGTGDEIFGWVPGHLLDKVKLLPRNAPRTEYFVDGPISVYDAWLGDGSGTDITKTVDEWATVLITGYREGGSGYMALDVTDPAATAAPHGPYPRLLWEFGDADLGESWSEAVVARVKMKGAPASGDQCGIPDGDGDCREQWVAVFSGGYSADGDPNRPDYVADPADASWSDRSKAIYVVALDTGTVLGKVEFDATGSDGPTAMKFAIPSTPAVLDLDFDGFADVIYVGDLGGQVWKWDVHALGEDSDADPLVDNWPAGVFFETNPAVPGSGPSHYRSFFFPPVATFLDKELVLAFGSGERHDLLYPGQGSLADENRFYVVKDTKPYGPGAFPVTLGDADLTDITGSDTDTDPLDKGFRFDLSEGEKFVTQVTVFAGYVIVGSYSPLPSADLCATASGQSYLHAFRIRDGRGLFSDPADPPSEDRREFVGGGMPSDPSVVVGSKPDDDVILIRTSDGPRVIAVDAPPREDPTGALIYWRKQL